MEPEKILSSLMRVWGFVYAREFTLWGMKPGRDYANDPAYLMGIVKREDGSLETAAFSFEPLPQLPEGERRLAWGPDVQQVVVERGADAAESLANMRAALDEFASRKVA